MAIYYKGKKVASNRNVNHKDFVDCRDVEFTNPQDGDVPTWDSTAQKLVNRPAHGVFELWNNTTISTFAGQSVEIDSDVIYDNLDFVMSLTASETQMPPVYSLSKEVSSSTFARTFIYDGLGANKYLTMGYATRNVSVAYNSTTHKYTITFGDCTLMTKATNVQTTSTSATANTWLIPIQIRGVIHND